MSDLLGFEGAMKIDNGSEGDDIAGGGGDRHGGYFACPSLVHSLDLDDEVDFVSLIDEAADIGTVDAGSH